MIAIVELTTDEVPDKPNPGVAEQRRWKKSSSLIHEKVVENKKNPEEAAEGENDKAVEVKLLNQNTTDTGTETEVSPQRPGSNPASEHTEESEWKEIKAPPTIPISHSEENVYFKNGTDIPVAEHEESISASKLYLPKMGETEINFFAKQTFDSASVVSISSMDQPKPGTSKTSTSSVISLTNGLKQIFRWLF